jgi:hypothetical protein
MSLEDFGVWAPYIYGDVSAQMIRSTCPLIEFNRAPPYNTYMMMMTAFWITTKLMVPHSQKHTAKNKRALMVFGPPGCGKSTIMKLFRNIFGARFVHHVGIGQNPGFQNPDFSAASIFMKDEITESDVMKMTGNGLFKEYSDATSLKQADFKYRCPLHVGRGCPLVLNTNESIPSVLRALHGHNPSPSTYAALV